MKIFQIGNVPVHFHQERWHGWDLNARSKPTDLLWSSDSLFSSRPYQPDQQKIKISSIVVDEKGLTPRHQIERLKNLLDTPTTIIAYDLEVLGSEGGCICQVHGRHEVMWYSTVGALTGIAEEEEADGVIRVTVEIIINPSFTALNRYLWSWQSGDFNAHTPAPTTPYASLISRYPDTFGEFGAMHWSRRVVDRLVAYDPALWPLLHKNTGVRLPTGLGSTWGASHHVVEPSTFEWSAPPLSIYAFKNLAPTDTIILRINRADGAFGRMTEDTTIDLPALNASLLAMGVAGLQLTDIIYIGDVYPKPGFLVRGGAVLNVRVPVAYSGLWPGMVFPGRTGVQIYFPDGVDGHFAYLHSYRRI